MPECVIKSHSDAHHIYSGTDNVSVFAPCFVFFFFSRGGTGQCNIGECLFVPVADSHLAVLYSQVE